MSISSAFPTITACSLGSAAADSILTSNYADTSSNGPTWLRIDDDDNDHEDDDDDDDGDAFKHVDDDVNAYAIDTDSFFVSTAITTACVWHGTKLNGCTWPAL